VFSKVLRKTKTKKLVRIFGKIPEVRFPKLLYQYQTNAMRFQDLNAKMEEFWLCDRNRSRGQSMILITGDGNGGGATRSEE
jgi:hypothetical protein